jgi:hypothetical protein
MRIRVSVSLFTCKHCRRDYNNKLAHVCYVPWTAISRPAPMRKKGR